MFEIRLEIDRLETVEENSNFASISRRLALGTRPGAQDAPHSALSAPVLCPVYLSPREIEASPTHPPLLLAAVVFACARLTSVSIFDPSRSDA